MCRWQSTALAAIVTSTLTAQFLTIPPGPATPGSTIIATYNNNTAAIASHPLNASPVSLLHPEGELITPRATPNQGITWSVVPPGGTETFAFTVPSAGPGSSGSFVLLYPWAPAAVGRLDVGVASPSFPAIVAFPPNVHVGYGTHAMAFGSPSASWTVGNTSAVSFTFATPDQIQIFAPGGTVPLAAQSLAGITVPPGTTAMVPVPVGTLAPGPHTVAMSWTDPLAGPIIRRFGIHEANYADLYLPDGKVVPFGGSLRTFTNCDFLAPGVPGSPLYFVQLADLSIGSTFLPTGQLIPLVADPVAIACITNSLFGLIMNGQGIATAIPAECYGYCGPPAFPPPSRYQTGVTTIFNPSLPGLTGTVFRLATLLFDPIGARYVATQGEEIVLG